MPIDSYQRYTSGVGLVVHTYLASSTLDKSSNRMMTNESLTKYFSFSAYLHHIAWLSFQSGISLNCNGQWQWEWGHRLLGKKDANGQTSHVCTVAWATSTMTMPGSAALCDVIYKSNCHRCQYRSLHLSHRLLKLNTDSD